MRISRSSTPWRSASGTKARLLTDYHHAIDVACGRRWRRAPGPRGRAAKPARRERRLGAVAPRRHGAVASSSCRRTGRWATCPAAGKSAWRWRRRWSARPTCCCWTSPPTISTSPPSHGSSSCCRTSTAPSCASRHDRRFLDTVATRIVELDRGRLLVLSRQFRRVPGAQGTPAGRRGRGQRQVRQGAGAGGGVDPPGRRGAADAQRRPRAATRSAAARARGAARTLGPRQPATGRRRALGAAGGGARCPSARTTATAR